MSRTLKAIGFSNALVEQSVAHLLNSNTLCSIATASPDGNPHINTCFYAPGGVDRIYILTPPQTIHSLNLLRNPFVAISIFDSHQVSGAELRGLQVFGRCHRADDATEHPEVFEAYTARFTNIREYAPDAATMLKVFESRLYVIEVDSLKVFDEPMFGKEVWVTAVVAD